MAQISKSRRFAVLARDGFKCRYCGRAAPDFALQVDHVVPRSRGGNDLEGNLVAACTDCNAGKSDSLLKPAGDGFRVDALKMAKRAARLIDPSKPTRHMLECSRVGDLDEESGGQQQAYVYCRLHGKFEWHWLPLDLVESDYTLERYTMPGWRG
ncbi:MAG: HNH endonuclease [Alphaproteobacteria bacterium]|nr:MAG: HNH endonuclease [Alphaproteobacteria bacterium]